MSYDPEVFSHYYWHDNAKRHRYSAEVLYEKLSELYEYEDFENLQELNEKRSAIFQSYMMLIGFALENLIKAVAIKNYLSKGNQIFSFEDLQKKVWRVKNAHNIGEIAKNCDFPSTEKELDLLNRYSEFVMWAGRYHIPKHKPDYDKAFGDSRLRRKIGDHLIIESIFSKSNTLLEDNGS